MMWKICVIRAMRVARARRKKVEGRIPTRGPALLLAHGWAMSYSKSSPPRGVKMSSTPAHAGLSGQLSPRGRPDSHRIVRTDRTTLA